MPTGPRGVKRRGRAGAARGGLTLSVGPWEKFLAMNAVRDEPLRVMLGFVVRQCAVALGRKPTPVELSEWANNQRDEHGRYRVFGRAITPEEATVILRHPGRLVTVRPGPRWMAAVRLARVV
jgi:hypothetical protein